MSEPTYTPLDWHNSPATDTPLDEDNLNHIEQGISDAIDRAVTSVRYDVGQSLNPTQQALARGNLALGSAALADETDFQPEATPSYVGARSRTFDPRASLYNATAVNLRAVRALASSARQGGTLRMTMIGDSTTAGSGASAALSYPVQLRTLLAASGCPVKGTGLVFAGQGVTDPRWSHTGTVTDFGQMSQMSAASTKTFASDLPGTTAVVRFFRNGTGTFTITVDGSAPSSGVTVVGGTYSTGTVTLDGTNNPGSITFTGLADTTHTIVVTSTATTFLIGAKVTGSAGVEINNMGVASTVSGDWTSTAFATDWQMATQETPDVIMIALGVNDGTGAVAVNTFKTNLTTIVTNAQAIAPVILVAQINSLAVSAATQQTYVNAIYDVADTKDVPVLDLMHRWGGYAAANTLGLIADTVHMNAKGYSDWSQALYEGLQLGGISAVLGTVDNGDGTLSDGVGDTWYTKAQSDTLLAAKAPTASPTFTGTPAAPTASAGTNTTQLATTAFVATATAASGATKTSNYTMVDADDVLIGNGSSITITLPTASGVTAWKRRWIKNIHSSALTVSGTLDGTSSHSLAQYDALTVISDGSQWLIV